MLKSYRRVHQIHESTLRFLEPLSLDETYAAIVGEAIKLVGAVRGTLFLNERGNFVRVYSNVPLGNQIKPRKRGYVYKTFVNKKITTISKKNFQLYHPEFQSPGINSLLFIPITHKNKTLGVVTLDSNKRKGVTPEEIEILKVFSSFTYLTIQKTRLYSTTKDALDARDLFTSIAAHNFRTPLTSIIGYTDMIYKKTQNNQLPKIEWLKTMKSDINQLKNLLNNLLESTQIKAGKFEYRFTQCNVCEIIQRSITSFMESKPQYKVDLKNHIHESKCLLIGDQDKLSEVFWHLLNNSAEFSPPDKAIDVEIQTNKSDINILIKDKGKGIPPKDRPHIFKQFYRGSNTKREGMGMGLYLAKNIIEKHRGNIRVQSILSKGTKVKVTLPRLKYEQFRKRYSTE